MTDDHEHWLTPPSPPTAPPRARLARLGDWLGARWCGLTTGHYLVRTITPTRVTLCCWYCGYESPGWTVTEEDRTASREGVRHDR